MKNKSKKTPGTLYCIYLPIYLYVCLQYQWTKIKWIKKIEKIISFCVFNDFCFLIFFVDELIKIFLFFCSFDNKLTEWSGNNLHNLCENLLFIQKKRKYVMSFYPDVLQKYVWYKPIFRTLSRYTFFREKSDIN